MTAPARPSKSCRPLDRPVEQHYYAEYRAVEERHWWFLGRRTILLSLLDRHVPVGDPAKRVLDVGCGTGAMLQQLDRYGTVDGVDADQDAVRFCQDRGIDRVRLLENGALPWDSGTFDLVTALDVIEIFRRTLYAEVKLLGGGTVPTLWPERPVRGAEDPS